MKGCKNSFAIVVFLTLQVISLTRPCIASHEAALMRIIDPAEPIPQPLEPLFERLKSEFAQLPELQIKLENAKTLKPAHMHALGTSYQSLGAPCLVSLADLYKHSAICGSSRAWYSLGLYYKTKKNNVKKAKIVFLLIQKRQQFVFVFRKQIRKLGQYGSYFLEVVA